MLADMHSHYPMHVIADVTPASAVEQMRRQKGRGGLGDRFRAFVVRVLGAFINNRYPWSGYRLSVEGLTEGGVGFVWSTLYRPFDEMDLSKPYAAPPEPGYYAQLVGDLEDVEAEIGSHDDDVIRVAHDRAELDAGIERGGITVVHAVEGGFHLGDGEEEVAENVADLARRGVAYITLPHLFYRRVATNAPAIPFLPDWLYAKVFPQPKDEGLTDRGRAAVRAMVENGILVDLTHSDELSFAAVVALLDELDPGGQVPFISSHAGYRFGRQKYMHSEEQILQVKRRDGVIGLLMAQHQLCDGITKHTETFDESFDVICKHIDRIRDITGSHRHVALGSDFDGFIKPTMGGLEAAPDFAQLETRLRELYGEDAEAICSGNALRVLRKVWT